MKFSTFVVASVLATVQVSALAIGRIERNDLVARSSKSSSGSSSDSSDSSKSSSSSDSSRSDSSSPSYGSGSSYNSGSSDYGSGSSYNSGSDSSRSSDSSYHSGSGSSSTVVISTTFVECMRTCSTMYGQSSSSYSGPEYSSSDSSWDSGYSIPSSSYKSGESVSSYGSSYNECMVTCQITFRETVTKTVTKSSSESSSGSSYNSDSSSRDSDMNYKSDWDSSMDHSRDTYNRDSYYSSHDDRSKSTTTTVVVKEIIIEVIRDSRTGGYRYSPSHFYGNKGDHVTFHWSDKSTHDITRSSSSDYCTPYSGSGSFTSGSMSTSDSSWDFYLTDSNPTWYHSSQGSDCSGGMWAGWNYGSTSDSTKSFDSYMTSMRSRDSDFSSYYDSSYKSLGSHSDIWSHGSDWDMSSIPSTHQDQASWNLMNQRNDMFNSFLAMTNGTANSTDTAPVSSNSTDVASASSGPIAGSDTSSSLATPSTTTTPSVDAYGGMAGSMSSSSMMSTPSSSSSSASSGNNVAATSNHNLASAGSLSSVLPFVATIVGSVVASVLVLV